VRSVPASPFRVAERREDAVFVAAAAGGAVVMAFGVVLGKRWTSPAPLLATTGWQLVAGWLVLGQRLGAWQLAGGALALAAVVAAQRRALGRTAANRYQPLTSSPRAADPEVV
jgi:drug/metabolite transporter (DMT)-like permease